MSELNPYPASPRSGGSTVQRYTVLAVIVLCTVICLLLALSLLSAWGVPESEAVPSGWRWLLGTDVQTFRSETIALLLGTVLLGFAVGGIWFLLAAGWRWFRRLF